MLPGSRHAPPLSQRPNSCVWSFFEQATGWLTGCGAPDQPQQSLSFRQISPVGAHPDAGSQINSPAGAPVGAQTREQHFPPQVGGDEVLAPQMTPLTVH